MAIETFDLGQTTFTALKSTLDKIQQSQNTDITVETQPIDASLVTLVVNFDGVETRDEKAITLMKIFNV